MPDFSKEIAENAQPIECYEESPAFVEDKNIIDHSIKVNGDLDISGTTFEGDCYIIAEGDITYNVQQFESTGRVFLYSENGSITINGTEINVNGAAYAPNGSVIFNAYDTTITGFVCADTIIFNGSIFNVSAANFDMVTPQTKSLIKTYTVDEDFNEGSFNGLDLSIRDQLTLSEGENKTESAEKVYYDSDAGKGVKITYSSDKSVAFGNETVTLKYDLCCFGEADINDNSVDLILVIDESGSMSGQRMTNTKRAAKEIVEQMKPNDRCAVIGFSSSSVVRQSLTSDKNSIVSAIDKLRASGGTSIYKGIDSALEMFSSTSGNDRQKYIILLSDGEDGSKTQSINSAKRAGENNIRIFAMMIGTGTLQMQNIAINSNGIYKNAPTTDDIGKIMSYFASEVFNVAARNATFKTTIKDSGMIDLNSIVPNPSVVTPNDDGSLTIEWNFDRISLDEAVSISLPIELTNSDSGFTELTENTTCVYYDRNGSPHVVYMEDTAIPVNKYVDNGNWSVVFDSERPGAKWNNIYWNGSRYGDGEINVSAAVSENGIDFSELQPVINYGSIDDLCGRYIKLYASISSSFDGKSPELYDITLIADSEDHISYQDDQPLTELNLKSAIKVNVPVTARIDVADDCLSSSVKAVWSCDNDLVTFSNSNGFITSIVASEVGTYSIKCRITDGNNVVELGKTIEVEAHDEYDDISPEIIETYKPEIAVDLPEYADLKQVINAKIESLNDTEISWYSVIFNGNTAIDVSDDGSFKLTMPNRSGKNTVTVRAFDWSGNCDLKEYDIIVDSTVPKIEILASKNEVFIGDAAYFTVVKTAKNKIKSISYFLNDEPIVENEEDIYYIDTLTEGNNELIVKAITNSEKTITANSTILRVIFCLLPMHSVIP